MTIDELFNELENKVRDTVIVTLKYKYDFEENYTIENHILEYDAFDDSYVWLNDWYEGQTDIEVLGYIPLGDVSTLTCEDCISREAAENTTWEEPSYTDVLNVLTEVREKIRQLLPVTPKPKIGHWIIDINDRDYCICSECKHRFDVDHLKFSWDIYDFPPSCPNCGAKMEEVEK